MTRAQQNENIISEVEKRRPLWDIKCAQYKDTTFKFQLWQQVAEAVAWDGKRYFCQSLLLFSYCKSICFIPRSSRSSEPVAQSQRLLWETLPRNSKIAKERCWNWRSGGDHGRWRWLGTLQPAFLPEGCVQYKKVRFCLVYSVHQFWPSLAATRPLLGVKHCLCLALGPPSVQKQHTVI